MPRRNYVHFELLLNRVVVDAHGRKAGRIEEAEVERRDGEYVVTAFVVGRLGLAERFSIHHFGDWIMRFLGARDETPDAQRIPWDQLDLSDWEHPRLR